MDLTKTVSLISAAYTVNSLSSYLAVRNAESEPGMDTQRQSQEQLFQSPNISELQAHFSALPHRTSYCDIHVYFDDSSVDKMMIANKALRQQGLRVFDVVDRPIFCHPTPMFEAHVEHAEAAATMAFLHELGTGLSMLIHPNTSDGVKTDHTTHARWVGPSLQNQVSAFFAASSRWQ